MRCVYVSTTDTVPSDDMCLRVVNTERNSSEYRSVRDIFTEKFRGFPQPLYENVRILRHAMAAFWFHH
jgi:hypothetical protein